MKQTQDEAIRDAAHKGTSPAAAETTEQIRLKGLALQDMVRRPLAWFKHNPENDVFAASKSPAYWQDLERDIREAGIILSPLIAMPDGLLIEGESRLTIARKLSAEGLLDFDVLPVRIIKGELTEVEQRRRLYLGNLSRFEIDANTRATLYARIWPDLTREAKPGPASSAGKGVTETVSVTSAVKDLAASAGITERQAWNEKKVIEGAEAERKSEGAPVLRREHVQKARAKVNAARRGKAKAPAKRKAGFIRLPRKDAELVLQILRQSKPANSQHAAAIKIIEKALKR